MDSICVIVNKYPNSVEPNVCVFIQQLIWSLADMGIQCSVICPMPLNFNIKYIKIPFKCIEKNENGKEIIVYRPKYFSLGQGGRVLQKWRVAVTTNVHTFAVNKVLKMMKKKPDVLYSHFICPPGVTAARLGRKYSIPSFMACGEALYVGDTKYGNKKLAKELSGLSGLIAVSSQNKDYCVNAGIVDESIVRIFPNGYRRERFIQHDKLEARKKFGWDTNAFIVGFCGSFDERKGILRLQNAVGQIDGVQFACAGKGKQVPTSEKCIWARPVNNSDLAWFYSALDVFALPTRHEGCCNAIVEAIACGCPIISSDRPFNVDICDETNSILIEPDDVEQLSSAIKELKDDSEKRDRLSRGSLEKAKTLTLEQRAHNIVDFINEKAY